VRVFEVPAVPEKMPELREALFTELDATLGTERSELFQRPLRDWMPTDDQDRGVNSAMAVLPFQHRELFYRPKPGEEWLPWGMSAPGTYMQAAMNAADIPSTFRKYLQDWIAIAQSLDYDGTIRFARTSAIESLTREGNQRRSGNAKLGLRSV
jgi:hypothetical protein